MSEEHPLREPTEKEQREFWRLQRKALTERHHRSGIDPLTGEWEIEPESAEDEWEDQARLDAFLLSHMGVAFKLFDPEVLQKTFDPTATSPFDAPADGPSVFYALFEVVARLEKGRTGSLLEVDLGAKGNFERGALLYSTPDSPQQHKDLEAYLPGTNLELFAGPLSTGELLVSIEYESSQFAKYLLFDGVKYSAREFKEQVLIPTLEE